MTMMLIAMPVFITRITAILRSGSVDDVCNGDDNGSNEGGMIMVVMEI